MTRPFGVKGKKRKAKGDHVGDEEQQMQPKKPMLQNQELTPTPTPATQVEEELPGIPIAPSDQKSNKPNVVFILERASLEVAKVGKVLYYFLREFGALFIILKALVL